MDQSSSAHAELSSIRSSFRKATAELESAQSSLHRVTSKATEHQQECELLRFEVNTLQATVDNLKAIQAVTTKAVESVDGFDIPGRIQIIDFMSII